MNNSFDLRTWLVEHRHTPVREWLANHSSVNMVEWLNEHGMGPSISEYLQEHPSFNTTAWLDAQPVINTEQWLQKTWSEANETGGSHWRKLAPDSDVAQVTGPGFCCCGDLCEKASNECCGPWFPSFKGVKASRLAQAKRSTLSAAKKQRFIQLAAEVRWHA